MSAAPNVVVVGPGAVGCYFGGMLARAGAAVTMLGRPARPSPHLDAMARDGLRMETVTFDELVKVFVTTQPEVVAGADLVLIAVKTMHTDDAATGIAPYLRSQTPLVGLQNGVDGPDRMRRAGLDPIPAVVFVAAEIVRPGVVKHRARGDLVIGHKTRGSDLERVRKWCESAGIGVRISDHVEKELWIKLVINSMTNAISALTDAPYGPVVEFAPTWALADAVLDEALLVARSSGFELDPDEVRARALEVCRAAHAATSSTQQDLARGRPTEIDSLNGFLAMRAEQCGVDAPANRTLSALVKLKEQMTIAQSRAGAVKP
jgi:2-dehydropantoate 2-reductase